MTMIHNNDANTRDPQIRMMIMRRRTRRIRRMIERMKIARR